MTIEQAKAEGIIVNPFLVRIFDRNQTIRTMYAEGCSISFIAAQFNMKPREVRGAIGRKNIVR